MSSYLTELRALYQLHLKKRPVVLSHEINSRCNLKCSFCDYWRYERDELDTDEIFYLLEQAKSFGILFYNVWATEPLLRKDLPDILEHAHKLGMTTSLITNGLLLENRIDELDHLDYLSISLDSIKSLEEIRGIRFNTVLPGIIKARDKLNKEILINCVLSKKNLEDVEDLVKLAKDLGMKISFEPIHKIESIDSTDWSTLDIKKNNKYQRVIDKLILMKKKGYPIINSITYLELVKNMSTDYKCHASDIILNVTSNGTVEHCRLKKTKLGDISSSLEHIWNNSKAIRNDVTSNCSGCLFFGYVENSLLYNFKPEVIKNYEWM